MTTRVTADEVRQILDTETSEMLSDDTTIDAFIDAANVTVTALLASEDLTTAQLKEIERWFTAHLIACGPMRQVRSETVGQSKTDYDSKVGLGLDLTSYGQQVKLLDTTGAFANKLGKRKASTYAIITENDAGELAHE
jgi:hypothetical protein